MRTKAGDDDSTEPTPACHQPRKPKYINLSDSSGCLKHRNETLLADNPLGRVRLDKKSRAGFPTTFVKPWGTLPGKIWQSIKHNYVEECLGPSFRFSALRIGLA